MKKKAATTNKQAGVARLRGLILARISHGVGGSMISTVQILGVREKCADDSKPSGGSCHGDGENTRMNVRVLPCSVFPRRIPWFPRMDAKQSEKQLLGRRIKELRAKRGYSQEALAERMNINAKYLGSVELGNENPTLDLLINCAKALGVELLDLFNFTWLTLRERQLRDKIRHLAERGDIDQIREVFVLMRSRDL